MATPSKLTLLVTGYVRNHNTYYNIIVINKLIAEFCGLVDNIQILLTDKISKIHKQYSLTINKLGYVCT